MLRIQLFKDMHDLYLLTYLLCGSTNVCVLRHQRILLSHRHVFKQPVIERSVLRRQKPGTVFRQKWFRLRNDLYCVRWGVKLYSLTHSPRQKWRNQWHCRHLNKNLKLTFFTVISRHVISPHIDVQWLQCFCICSLKIMIDWLINWLIKLSAMG